MYLAETFVHTLTPCILHKYSCVFDRVSILGLQLQLHFFSQSDVGLS